MQQGRIFFQERAATLDIRVQGRGTMDESVPLKRLIERRLAAGTNAFVIRLDECTYMDSTFVGTIVFVMRAAQQRSDVGLTIASPSQPCRELLRAMHLDSLLTITDSAPPAEGPWVALESGARDLEAFKNTVLRAHQELARLPGEAGETFEAVAHDMAAELERERDKPAPPPGPPRPKSRG